MPVPKILQSIFYSGLALVMFSCEGAKFIAVENKSKDDITVTILPGVQTPELVDYPKTYRTRNDTILILSPDSTLLIPTYFGPLYIFNEKIKQEELNINYIKITSKTDTIVANNKAELFKMLRKKRNIAKLTVK